MNLKKLYDVSIIVNAADINQLVFFNDNGKVTISGADDSHTAIVYNELDTNDLLVDKTIAIQSVPVLMKRLELFDFDKAVATETCTDEFVKSIEIKESRKKISYTFTNPKKLSHIPNTVTLDEKLNSLVINKSMFDELTKASQALGTPKLFNLKGDGNSIYIELSDGNADGYENIIGENTSGNWMYSWSTSKFLKLVRYAMREQEEVTVVIGDRGLMRIEINGITIFLISQIN